MEFHPITECFELIEGRAFEELCEDVASNGLITPIWTWQNKIIDGRNRFRACKKTKTEPRFQEWSGKGSLAGFVASLNIHRRNQTPSQRAMAGAKLAVHFQEESKSRMLAGVKADPPANLREGSSKTGTSGRRAAAAVGVSPRSVDAATRVLKNGSHKVISAVEHGSLAVSRAERFVNLPPREQFKLIQQEEQELLNGSKKRDEQLSIAKGLKCLVRSRRLFEDTAAAKAIPMIVKAETVAKRTVTNCQEK